MFEHLNAAMPTASLSVCYWLIIYGIYTLFSEALADI